MAFFNLIGASRRYFNWLLESVDRQVDHVFNLRVDVMPESQLRMEVVSGSLKGQSAILHDHGSMIVGRLPECGISVSQDMTVSRQHFRVEYDAPVCTLTHLSQTGETLVNGSSVTSAELRAGDEIAFGAGNTIRVFVDYGRDPIAAPTAPHSSDSSRSPAANGFTALKASCGWNMYESVADRPGFRELLQILDRNQRIGAIIDFRRIEQPVPDDLVDAAYLFPWIQAPMRDQMSPILISIPDNPAVLEMIGDHVGKDGVVCFGSSFKRTDVIEHWKTAIGVVNDQPGTAMTAYHWPSLLNAILTCQLPENVGSFLGGFNWIFIESPKSPGQWRLFAKDDLAPELTKAGLVAMLAPVKTK
ncbi:FHA domain-containing protein [Schlesneria paludicola]|uniref:FHA domain-containing protein n=1 Tax=Schlesneria paludicola TaxID=360056 RepID=UPI0012F97CB7|nr:FHA domain-containing protein [Schlesneria paludicola]